MGDTVTYCDRLVRVATASNSRVFCYISLVFLEDNPVVEHYLYALIFLGDFPQFR